MPSFRPVLKEVSRIHRPMSGRDKEVAAPADANPDKPKGKQLGGRGITPEDVPVGKPSAKRAGH